MPISGDYSGFIGMFCRCGCAPSAPSTPGGTLGEKINRQRRRFFGGAAIGLAAAEFATAAPAWAQEKPANAHIASAGPDSPASFPAIKTVNAGDLKIGYAEAGPPDGPAVILLHGWPYDIHSYVDVAPLLAAEGYRVLVPYVRGCGATTFLSSDTIRTGQPAALATDVIAFMDALNIQRAIIGGYDWGGRTADIIAAIWPARCKALVSVSGYLISSRDSNKMPLPPKAEYQWWYQYYFATQRGLHGYMEYRREFGRLIWQLASPKWNFGEAVFNRTANAFDNPDYVAIVIHNYRWRLSLAEGEPKYDELETRIGAAPVITVPTITLEGDANGAPHPDTTAYAAKFSGTYTHRVITGGIGHNLPQEAPQAFAQAIIDVDHA